MFRWSAANCSDSYSLNCHSLSVSNFSAVENGNDCVYQVYGFEGNTQYTCSLMTTDSVSVGSRSFITPREGDQRGHRVEGG